MDMEMAMMSASAPMPKSKIRPLLRPNGSGFFSLIVSIQNIADLLLHSRPAIHVTHTSSGSRGNVHARFMRLSVAPGPYFIADAPEIAMHARNGDELSDDNSGPFNQNKDGPFIHRDR